MKSTIKKAIILILSATMIFAFAVPAAAATNSAAAGKQSVTLAAATAKKPITSVKLNSTKLTLEVGKKSTLKVTYAPANTTDSKTVKWTSSNTAVATVSKGTITAKKAGTAKITAKMGNKTATCTVTVKAASAYVNTSECYTILNQYRTKAKVKTLKKDATLESIAKTRAKELVTKFSHTRPNGQRGINLIKGNVYKGENIAKGQTTCKAVMTDWNNSAGHRANMIKKNYTKVGIAGYKYKGVIYWVQIFSS